MSKTNNPTSADTDGWVKKSSTTNWAGSRDATDGDGRGNSLIGSTNAVYVDKGTNRDGDDEWHVYRSYLAFDTSMVSASFNLYDAKLALSNDSGSHPNGDVIVVKSNKPDLSTDIAHADFDDLPGFSAGNTMDGNVTDYSSVFPSGSYPTGDNVSFTIDLNASAFADIKSGDVLKLAVVNYNYDYKNVDPNTVAEANGMSYTDNTSTGRRPVLQLKWGFGHSVMGIDHRFMAKIAGVEDDRVKKVFSKDSS